MGSHSILSAPPNMSWAGRRLCSKSISAKGKAKVLQKPRRWTPYHVPSALTSCPQHPARGRSGAHRPPTHLPPRHRACPRAGREVAQSHPRQSRCPLGHTLHVTPRRGRLGTGLSWLRARTAPGTERVLGEPVLVRRPSRGKLSFLSAVPSCPKPELEKKGAKCCVHIQPTVLDETAQAISC